MKRELIIQRAGRHSSHHRDAENDSLAYYLREVARHPLLDRRQEQEIGNALASARQSLSELSALYANDAVTIGEYAERRARIEGDLNQVRNRLVTANLRLVVSIAKRFRNKGLTLMDLINEGNLGLIHAAGRFDCAKGCKFSTYATWWVRQAIEKALADSGRTIRVPAHVINHLRMIEREALRHFEEHGVEPSMALLSAAVQLPERKVRDYLGVMADTASLDAPLEGQQDGAIIDLQPSEGYGEPFDWVLHALAETTFRDALHVLDPREREIVSLRFGLCGRGPLTLEEIGNEAGITRERVRQLLKAALARLREEPLVRNLAALS